MRNRGILFDYRLFSIQYSKTFELFQIFEYLIITRALEFSILQEHSSSQYLIITRAFEFSSKDYYQRLIDENMGNPKKMWKAIIKVLGKMENSVKLSSVEVEGKCLNSERDVLEALNQHFISVGPKLAKKIPTKPRDDCLQIIVPEQKEMKFRAVTIMHILSEIKS